jgi:DNA modification methylase
VKVLDQAHGADWTWYNGDSADVLPALPANSAHLPLFSPPFRDLYVYSASDRDLGNCKSPAEFWRHFDFIIPELLRVTVPGRLCCVHVADLATTLAHDGKIGVYDFTGDTIRAFLKHGWVYHSRITIPKNAQAQAIRTHAKGLLFVQLRKDSAWSRPALPDYLVVFRKPGENPVPVHPDITNDQWIEWADCVWPGIEEGDTLNARGARDNDDERHLCPLQLPVIHRAIRLWTNPGEVVLSPFGGVGSEGYEAVKLGRKFVGVELKPSYWKTGRRNLEQAASEAGAGDLFSAAGVEVAS